MKKKIGILTFFNANNYGAVLQAYALQNVLKNIYSDSDIEIINYLCNGIKAQRSLKSMINKQGLVSAAAHYPSVWIRVRKIDKFTKNKMILSNAVHDYKNLEKIADSYDLIISGSDQIWNKTWNGNDGAFLQEFHSHNNIKASYAASFGVKEIPEEWVKEYKENLKKFKHISVREAEGQKILENMGIKSDIHIDPTLLLDRSSWSDIACLNVPKKKYVLVYMVPYQKEVIDKAVEIGKEENLEIITICKSLKRFPGKQMSNASVEEFIGLLNGAEYIVTNSFHGTSFSVIFQKKCFIQLNNPRGYNVRCYNLLKTCGLVNEQDNEMNAVSLTKDADWNSVDVLLNKEREKSIKYLKSLLEE